MTIIINVPYAWNPSGATAATLYHSMKKKQSDNYDIYLRGVLSFSARMYVFFRSIFQLPNKSKEIYY